MRRPLLAVCLAITCVVALCYWLYPPPLPDRVSAGTEEILIYGRIEQKENRISYGKEQFILYLSDYSIYSSDLAYSSDSGAATDFGQAKSKKRNKNQIMCYIYSTVSESETGSCFEQETDGYRELKMGSFVLVRGKPEDFDRATNQGEFDSRLYYATLGIDFCVKKGEVLWESDSYSRFKEGLWKLRCCWQERLDDVLSDDAASVMKTMLLGNKTTLDRKLKSLYQDGGIAHILAISGLHISMIGMGIYRLLRRVGVPIWGAALLGAGLIFVYGVMTGSGVSTGRAVGMFLIRMMAEVLGRNYDMLTALGVLLLIMICQQPLYVYHSGFLLSFLALFGIGLLRPALDRGVWEESRYREGWEKRIYVCGKALGDYFLTSLSVTLATLPVTFWFFYEIPVYGVLLNLLVLPLMPPVMYLGLGILLVPKGLWLHIPAFLVEGILKMFEWLCKCSLTIPGQNFIRGKPEVWQIIVYVAMLMVIVLGKRWRTRRSVLKGIPIRVRLFVLGIAVWVLCFKCPGNAMITFLDVGQGDSICIQTGDGRAYLVDCGSSSENDIGKYVVASFLKSEGISYLEAVIITHPDADHCNGLEGLLEEGYAGRIGRLLLPNIPRENKDETYVDLENLAASYGVPTGYLSAGMKWEDNGMTFTCLNPGKVEDGTAILDTMDSNEYSVVLHVKSDNFSALFTGDVEGEGEEKLTEMLTGNGIEEVTVLKVAHHGSRYSTTEEFLKVLNAKVAVISCGEGNSYGHPHKELLERLRGDGMVVMTTPECGAVRIEIGKEIVVSRWEESD